MFAGSSGDFLSRLLWFLGFEMVLVCFSTVFLIVGLADIAIYIVVLCECEICDHLKGVVASAEQAAATSFILFGPVVSTIDVSSFWSASWSPCWSLVLSELNPRSFKRSWLLPVRSTTRSRRWRAPVVCKLRCQRPVPRPVAGCSVQMMTWTLWCSVQTLLKPQRMDWWRRKRWAPIASSALLLSAPTRAQGVKEASRHPLRVWP